jgi:hypothetical protein
VPDHSHAPPTTYHLPMVEDAFLPIGGRSSLGWLRTTYGSTRSPAAPLTSMKFHAGSTSRLPPPSSTDFASQLNVNLGWCLVPPELVLEESKLVQCELE